MDFDSLSISIIGVALTIMLGYYGFRTPKFFKGNVAARAWTYISLGAVFFAGGVVMSIAQDLQPLGLLVVGELMQTVVQFSRFLV